MSGIFGYLAIVLHAHLPFIRHPEHERFLEESWLYEAITDCYLPLIRNLESWWQDQLPVRLTLNLSPTLGCMLQDPLLQQRFSGRLERLIELAEKEILRTHWEQKLNRVAEFYLQRLKSNQLLWNRWNADLIAAFRHFEQAGLLEIITNSATHAVLPLLANHPPSLRAQVLVARDDFRESFGHDPSGFWLPECAYSPVIETALREAEVRWFILEAHGLQLANPRPKQGTYAPIITPAGLAAFGRDTSSARQVWSRQEGYPGDPRYRDFYRDIGYDLDFEYVQPCLPSPEHRGFTGIKYHRITGATQEKEIYDREEAVQVAAAHAAHFVDERLKQTAELAPLMDRPPILVCPYDAELFGHWWFEGPEFLDAVVRNVCALNGKLTLVTPSDYLVRHPVNAFGQPAPSTWGEGGHLRVWLNENNHEMHSRLLKAQEQMTALVRAFPHPTELEARALRQAARELLLAQSSDWAFMVHLGNADYPRQRFVSHLDNVKRLREWLVGGGIDAAQLRELETTNNVFRGLDYRYLG